MREIGIDPPDHFKAINDRYGHLCGDAVLAAVGVTVRDVGRSSNVRCRYGGEEFLLLLSGRADAALYQAKEEGRNCVRLSVGAAVA